MERLQIAFAIAVLLGGLVDPGLAEAASKQQEEAEAPAEAEPERRATRVQALRQDSLLRRDKPLAHSVDLRGELERRRDMEVIRHYTRVAQLDVIEELGRDLADQALLERVEAVRRKETRRFWAVMQRLREGARRTTARGTP